MPDTHITVAVNPAADGALEVARARLRAAAETAIDAAGEQIRAMLGADFAAQSAMYRLTEPLAHGGAWRPGGVPMVGESGPEAVVPSRVGPA